MLLDSFARLATAESPFRDTFLSLAEYAARHRDWSLLDPLLIAKDLPLLDVFTVAAALNEAVNQGAIQAKYTVLTPDGVVASEIFDLPREIPRVLYDRFEEPFETHRFPLVTVFEAASLTGAEPETSGDPGTLGTEEGA